METEPVVTIETPAGPTLINKSQYDANPKAYKLIGEKETPAETTTVSTTEAKQPLAVKKVSKGRGQQPKFVVVDADGIQVGDIEYNTEAEAIAAAFPAPAE